MIYVSKTTTNYISVEIQKSFEDYKSRNHSFGLRASNYLTIAPSIKRDAATLITQVLSSSPVSINLQDIQYDKKYSSIKSVVYNFFQDFEKYIEKNNSLSIKMGIVGNRVFVTEKPKSALQECRFLPVSQFSSLI